jgi:endonuclease G
LIVVKNYTGFTVYIDCRNNGPIAYEMALVDDRGNVERGDDFVLDRSVPSECQMTTGDPFRVTPTEEATLGEFQRGHLADANALDNFAQSMADSFFVTNMLPQAARFNGGGGAWRRTEEIAECYREITPLRIWGGVIWGDDASNDLFVDTHNVRTP